VDIVISVNGPNLILTWTWKTCKLELQLQIYGNAYP